MNRPMLLAVILGVLAAAATAAVLVYAVMGSYRVSCEVCITFQGRTACREAVGKDRDDAIRTASDNACAFLASGMTQVVSCGSTPPSSATCRDP